MDRTQDWGMMADAAILILNAAALPLAEKIRKCLNNQATIYVLAGKIANQKNAGQKNIDQGNIGHKDEFAKLSQFAQQTYQQNRPIIAICASGIIIRVLAPILGKISPEPPVLSVAIDGSTIVPLLGVTSGANSLARHLAHSLGANAAITTSGELLLGLNLLNPPPDLELVNPEAGKKFISRLLDGAGVRVTGARHDWLTNVHLPIDEAASLQIHVALGDEAATGTPDRLVYRLRSGEARCGQARRGRVTIIGLGPGTRSRRTFAADAALRQADDIFGYGFYIEMAGPFLPHQKLYRSDNRQEIERAKAALDLAAQGRHVALVSSGDAGIFGMAAAFFEVLEQEREEAVDIDIIVEPGITAALAASSLFGAPLGGDFAIISLSDNLKPQSLIEHRLRLCARADMVMALYNPVSKARPHQIERALTILREERPPTIPVGLATDIGRKGEKISLASLADLSLADITSRTVLIIGAIPEKCAAVFG